MSMRRFSAFVSVAFLAYPQLAGAAGGIWCDADHANLKFHFKAATSRDGTSGLFNVEGRLETRIAMDRGQLPPLDIRDGDVVERWLGRSNVLVQVSKREPAPSRALILTIAAHAVDEAIYEGQYELQITAPSGGNATIRHMGKVRCGAD
jgi:hypothetical protein